MPAAAALVAFLLGFLVNLLALLGVPVPHVGAWSWLLAFAGLALLTLAGVPIPWRRS